MTVQYEQPNINGMPAPASLAYNSTAGALSFGSTQDVVPAIPAASFTFDAAAFAVSNTAANGTLIQFLQPGLYEVEFTIDNASHGASTFLNILLGKTDANDITAANGYPAASFVTPAGSGVVAISELAATTPGFVSARAVVRLDASDVEDLPNGDPNPASLLVFAVTAAAAPDGGTTSIEINRISA